MAIETRPPKSTRLKTSRPRSSVPNQWASAWPLATVGEIDRVGRVRREHRRHGGDEHQRGQRDPGAPHAATRGSSQACTTSASRLKTMTASELTISIAISTV